MQCRVLRASVAGWHAHLSRTLVTRGVPVGKQRVQKLMELHGIRARGKRRFEVTTDSHHQLPISPGWLDREFMVAGLDTVWVGDITYLATDEGWLHMGWSLRGDRCQTSSPTCCAWPGSSAPRTR